LEQVEFPPDVEESFEKSINFGRWGISLYLFSDVRERKRAALDNNSLGG